MEELRVDPSDGMAYGKRGWRQAYGERVQEMWDKAGTLTVWHASKQTQPECIARQLFGGNQAATSPAAQAAVYPNASLLLFNIQSKEVMFPVYATSSIGHFEPKAWNGRFPCQVRVDTSDAKIYTADRALQSMLKRAVGTPLSFDQLPLAWRVTRPLPVPQAAQKVPGSALGSGHDAASVVHSPPSTPGSSVQSSVDEDNQEWSSKLNIELDWGIGHWDLQKAGGSGDMPCEGADCGDGAGCKDESDQDDAQGQYENGWMEPTPKLSPDIKAKAHQATLCYIRLNSGNAPASKRARETFCSALDSAAIPCTEWNLVEPFNLEEEINAAQEIYECVVIISGRDGGNQIGVIWTDERNEHGGTIKHEVRIDSGLRHLISQLSVVRTVSGDIGTTESGELRPSVGMKRDAVAHEIVHKLAAILIHGLGPQTKFVPQDQMVEAVKSSAKLISSFIFKELSDDNSTAPLTCSHNATASTGWSTVGARGRATLGAERWRRRGQRADPMIPSSAEAWPALNRHLTTVLTRWWNHQVTPQAVQAALDRLLFWCREGAKAITEEARRSVLCPGWTDAHMKVTTHPSTNDDATMTLACESGLNKSLKLSTARYGRLWQLYDRHVTQQQQNTDSQNDTVPASRCTMEQVNTRIYNVLMRYESLSRFDQGTQGAIPVEAFAVLQTEWGVDHECFASPLNCTLDSYNSLFPDVDGCFGSIGSFFDFFPEHGAFEANPPFDKDSVHATFQHIKRVLLLAHERQEQHRCIGSEDMHELPLLFVVVTPFVPADVIADKFVLWQGELAAHSHSYTLGMRHRGGSKNEQWTCTGNTALSFIGNRAASRKWPVTQSKLRKLRAAFR